MKTANRIITKIISIKNNSILIIINGPVGKMTAN